MSAFCARCGWHYMKHGSKNQCPGGRRNPDGSKPRYTRKLHPKTPIEGDKP